MYEKLLLVLIMALVCLLPACAEPTLPPPRVPEVIATIQLAPIKAGPLTEIAFDPHTEYTYGICPYLATIAVLQGTECVATIPIPEKRPSRESSLNGKIGVGDKYIYVTHQYKGEVLVLQGTKLVSRAPVDDSPTGVAVHPRTGYAYVTCENKLDNQWRAGSVVILHGAEIIARATVDEAPRDVVIEPRSGYVYIGHHRSDSIAIINGTRVIATIGLAHSLRAIDNHARSGRIYVLTTSELLVLQGTRIVQRVDEIGKILWDMQVHPLTGDVYVLNGVQGAPHGRDEVVIIRRGKIIARVEVGLAGYGTGSLAIDPLTGNVYVVCSYSDEVVIIHGTEVIGTLKVGWHPYQIAVNPQNGMVYVPNEGDATVTVLGFPD